MLHEFVAANREELIARCRAKIASRPTPRATDTEIEHGVPLFLDQLMEALRLALAPPVESNRAIETSATKHGNELMRRGFTVAQVVHDYGGVCQAITELAEQVGAPITAVEFRTLNLCLDDAIAAAVTEHGRLRDHEGTERLGRLAHELRGQLNTAFLAFEALRTGSVGVSGSTGSVLARSLTGLRNLIDRELTDVRLGAGILYKEVIVLQEFVADVESAAVMDAHARHLELNITPISKDVAVLADRQILASIVANLLHNAFKFTPAGGRIVLSATATDEDRVLIAIKDQCGGLPPGKAEELFRPFEQRASDRTGVGLGLAICRRGAQVNGGTIRLHNDPGTGCTFTLDLPRHPTRDRAPAT